MSQAAIMDLAFNRAQDRLALACSDGTVHVIESASGQDTLVLHSEGLRNVAFAGGDESLLAVGSSIEIYEPAEPSIGALRARETLWRARALLDPLLHEVQPLGARLCQNVGKQIEVVEVGADIRSSVLSAARAYLVARGDHAPTANSDAWSLVRDGGRSRADYEQGLRLAQAADAALPNNGSIVNTVGVAQLRCGQLAAAKATLERSEMLRKKAGLRPDASTLALIAMSEQAMGNGAAARATLSSAEAAARDERDGSAKAEARTFLDEAHRALGTP
jgi:hypothetical protein